MAVDIIPTELRIGNWVYEKYKSYKEPGRWVPTQVYTLDKEDVNKTYGWECEVSYEDTKGIELDPIWILKLGFTSIEGKENIYHINDGAYQLSYDVNNSLFYVHLDKDMGYGYVCGHLKYVHQLQNLYFAITGEELKIEL